MTVYLRASLELDSDVSRDSQYGEGTRRDSSGV